MPHRRGIPQATALGMLRAYKSLVSPLLPSACRFHPTCSAYASEAIARHGLAHGSLLAARRLLRCHPFSAGGIDLVPKPTRQVNR